MSVDEQSRVELEEHRDMKLSRGRLNIIALQHRHFIIVYCIPPTADQFFLSLAISVQQHRATCCNVPPSSGPVGAWPVTFGPQLYAATPLQ